MYKCVSKNSLGETESNVRLYGKGFFWSGAYSGKMLNVRIVENNKIHDYLGQVSFAPQC